MRSWRFRLGVHGDVDPDLRKDLEKIDPPIWDPNY